MYLKTNNCYKEYVVFSDKLKFVIISRLIMIYPEIRQHYINDMNPEEQMLFDAKVVRLEPENLIRRKCIDNIYPIDWVYNFEKEVNGREFTKRFRNVVSRMREKLFLLIEQYDFEKLYEDAMNLLSEVQQELADIRKKYPDFKNTDFDNFKEGKKFFLKYQLENTLAFIIYQKIYIASHGNRYTFVSMLYTYSYLQRSKYLKMINYCSDLFNYKDNSRMFSLRKMIRKYKEIPCVIAYLYKKDLGEADETIEHPTSVFEIIHSKINE